MSDEKKFAAYICTGCGIGDRLDAGQLENVATREGRMNVVKQHEMLCSKEGVKMIQDDIDNDGVTHVVIAACSRRAKMEAFAFPQTEVAVTRANLREGVIWARPDTEEAKETTQEMAEDYIRMSCGEIKQMNPPKPSGQQGRNPNVLVVGGGITGMTAALEAADAGYTVHLVEKTGQLGGHVAKLHKRVPFRAAPPGTPNTPDANLPMPEETGIGEIIKAVEGGHQRRVRRHRHREHRLHRPGHRFHPLRSQRTEGVQLRRLPRRGHQPGVRGADQRRRRRSHQASLRRQGSEGRGLRPGRGPEFRRGGQAALRLGRGRPGDLRTPGAPGEDFYRSGQKNGVIFTKGDVKEVVPGDTLTVKMHDKILDEDADVHADLVVLDVGMVPNSGPDPYAANESLEGMSDEEREEELEAQAEAAADENAVTVESILNLDYRQGTDLPQLKWGFTDSHFICFPYETRRTGIYAAGPVRRPMDIRQAMDDATGAAMKAIQEIENAAQGRAAHPRVGDLSYPTFRREGCTQCKRCTVECPFGAIDEDEERYPQYNESRCRRCGTCMGACPVRVISFENYSVNTVGAQIKECSIPEEWDEKPRILVLACENDAYPALDQAAISGEEISPWARVIPVRCLGSVSLSWVTDSLNNGFDGIIMMGCKRGDDYQCHFVRGSAMANERMAKVGDTLESLNLEPERVVVHEVAITDIERAPALIKDMEETIEKIGLSPFKF